MTKRTARVLRAGAALLVSAVVVGGVVATGGSFDQDQQLSLGLVDCLDPTEALVCPTSSIASATPTTTVYAPGTVGAATSPPTAPPATTPASGGTPTQPRPVCGNAELLTGPETPPGGATTVPAGDNSNFDFSGTGRTFWFAPGVHTLGTSEFSQITPADDQTYLGSPGAVLDGQNLNLYAFTQQAAGVTVQYLTIRNFGTGLSNNNEGVVNHDAGDNWLVANNTVIGNDGAGVFVGDGNVLRENCLQDNGQYGFSAYEPDGVVDVTIEGNEIVGNNTDDWEARVEGCGCTGGLKFWDTTGARIIDNWIHDNHSVGLWADTNNIDFLIERNWIEGNDGEGIFYEISYNATIRHNVLIRNNLVKGAEFASRGDDFPVAAIYLSEAGGEPRVQSTVSGSAELVIEANVLRDNWGGITGWENADRYCGSPANTSSDYCPRVGQVSLEVCVPGTIEVEPYLSDCRWKTQHMKVRDNTFEVTPSAVGCSGEVVEMEGTPITVYPCAKMALVANFGTFPDWSPYMGQGVQEAITLAQGNVWSANRYVGPWVFNLFEPGRFVTWTQWRSAPYGQDASSTLQ